MPVHELIILTKYSRSGDSEEPAHPHAHIAAHINIARAYI